MTLQHGDRVGVLTSGGDAPGMNAALRAAWRVGGALGLEVVGIDEGYLGLMDGRIRELDPRVLDDTSRRGGTVLGSARSKMFPLPEGQGRARETVLKHRLKGLMVIGGNGSLTGARTLMTAPTHDGGVLQVVGVPASIDNDLACTSMAIGVDTAMNTIVEACDRICDTASAHRRTFIIEVMGRECGYLAMTAAVAAGADVALVREVGKTDAQIVEQVVNAMDRAYARDSGKRRVLVMKAEGVHIDSGALKEAVDTEMQKRRPDVDTRVTVLGHVVRGGAPSAFDRMLGARLAHVAMRALAEGQTGVMAGWLGPGVTRPPSQHDPYVVLTPLDEVLSETARLMDGTSELAQWRKRVLDEVEPILAR